MPKSATVDAQFWMGFLSDREHKSYVLFDTQWPAAKTTDEVLLFCLHCKRIIALSRDVVRKEVRRLRPEEIKRFGDELVDGYRSARDAYETVQFGNGAQSSVDLHPESARPSTSRAPAAGEPYAVVNPPTAHVGQSARRECGDGLEKGVSVDPTTAVAQGNDWIDALKEKFRLQVSEIERRTDLSTDEKIGRITHIACSVCAGVAVQPIPFADIFILTPLQGYFGSRIAAIRGVPVTDSEATQIVKEVVGLMGLGLTAQHIAIAILKFLSFGGGGLLTVPLVYGLTYAIMKVIDAYYAHKAKGVRLSDDQIKRIFKEAMREGKEKSKRAEADVGDKAR